MRHALTIVACFASLGTGAPSAFGQLAPAEEPEPSEPTASQPVAPPPEADAVAFRVEKPRSTNNRILLGSLFGGAAAFAGVGLAFHFDSRTKSDEVSKVGVLSGEVWTADKEKTRKAALRSRNLAIGFYGVGAGLLAATIVTFIVTEPGEEVVELSALGGARPTFVATGDGAFLGAGWSFR